MYPKSRSAMVLVILASAVCALGMGACPGGTLTPGPGSVGSMDATETQRAMDALAAINAHRAVKGLAALTFHSAGAQVAFEHSAAMDAGSFFDHTNPSTGSTPASRAQAAGITHDPLGSIEPSSGLPFVGENIFMTTDPAATAQDAVDAWIASPGHHTQIDAPLPVAGAQVMPPWTHCAIGVHRNGNASWWTAMFFRNPN